MPRLELAIAVVLAVFGLRSLWRWARRPFDGGDAVDHLLYAAFVTGRVGLWFALAGAFVLYAVVVEQGDSVADFRWYLLVPLTLAAMQLVGGWFLGRRNSDPPA